LTNRCLHLVEVLVVTQTPDKSLKLRYLHSELVHKQVLDFLQTSLVHTNRRHGQVAHAFVQSGRGFLEKAFEFEVPVEGWEPQVGGVVVEVFRVDVVDRVFAVQILW